MDREERRDADQVAVLRTLLAEAHRKLAEAESEIERLRRQADDG